MKSGEIETLSHTAEAARTQNTEEANLHLFREGEPACFIDRKNRYYVAVLKQGSQTNVGGNILPHDEVIGRHEGFQLKSAKGNLYDVFRPTLTQSVLKMPRAATVIYPKDLGLIVTWGDIYPGATVVEAGIGTGAMAIALLRAVGTAGKVISYELREDFKNCAAKNIRTFHGEAPNHTIKTGDIYEGIEEKNIDRLVLDVPEPWRVVEHAKGFLRDGALFISYSPTVYQVKETVDALRRGKVFAPAETIEAILRPWEVSPQSMRPDLQIVGHTGFLTFARKRSGV